ncbi:4479_t:CDS:2 [Paraglomus occultum]|uniref:4479_t:CDS:1 n=1 Tax=Paraglomus occultum TaxID=144539 RepID=A0A9N9BD14_9GLOM|nr:4479_t:CDS:2 [Paraglomus occultum]
MDMHIYTFDDHGVSTDPQVLNAAPSQSSPSSQHESINKNRFKAGHCVVSFLDNDLQLRGPKLKKGSL